MSNQVNIAVTAETIRAARLRLGITQEAAARVLEVAVSTYQHWEQDVNMPRNARTRRAVMAFIERSVEVA